MFKPYYSGYAGAISIILTITLLSYLVRFTTFHFEPEFFYIAIVIALLMMVVYEMIAQKIVLNRSKSSNTKLIKSTLIRLSAILPIYIIMFCGVECTPFFDNSFLANSKLYFQYILIIISFLGAPYIFLTLKYRPGNKYEFNDYGILLIIFYRGIYRRKRLLLNRRIKKVFLSYVVSFFFVTLMVAFYRNEYQEFFVAFAKATSEQLYNSSWYIIFKNYFLLFFHLIFLVDVGIAVIGYTVSSRWLGNRVRSVDFTLIGWSVALICYPPFNSAIANNLIGYGRFDTYQLITNEYVLAFVLLVVLIMYVIYVWSTIALGFKISNLTNRGIITHGPFKYVRHPAYSAKNIAWWLDNTFVLTNIWATLSLLAWNVIYVFRGLTEEKHLDNDQEYINYKRKVKYRFIPRLF